jgi:hypothetical protein
MLSSSAVSASEPKPTVYTTIPLLFANSVASSGFEYRSAFVCPSVINRITHFTPGLPSLTRSSDADFRASLIAVLPPGPKELMANRRSEEL